MVQGQLVTPISCILSETRRFRRVFAYILWHLAVFFVTFPRAADRIGPIGDRKRPLEGARDNHKQADGL